MEEKHYENVSVLDITKAEKGGKCIVSFSDGVELTVTPAQIADFQLYSGRGLEKDEYSEVINALKLSKAKKRAVNILGSRNLSSAQIKKRLMSKGETEEVAGAVSDWLLELGLIDDELYARSIITHYISKGYGPFRIKDEMYKRGIPQDLRSDILAELDESSVLEAAQTFLLKKLKGSLDQKEVKSAANALIRRGFTYEQADSAISKYKAEMH